MSDSFLEEDQLSKANVRLGRRENRASSSSFDRQPASSSSQMNSSLPEVGVQIYSAGKKNHARNQHRTTWIFSTAMLETIKMCAQSRYLPLTLENQTIQHSSKLFSMTPYTTWSNNRRKNILIHNLLIISAMSSKWLRCVHEKNSAELRLICFPWAGGGAAFYANWGRKFASEIEGLMLLLEILETFVPSEISAYVRLRFGCFDGLSLI